MQDPRDIIRGVLQTSIALRQDMLSGSIDAIAKVADLLVATLQRVGRYTPSGMGEVQQMHNTSLRNSLVVSISLNVRLYPL